MASVILCRTYAIGESCTGVISALTCQIEQLIKERFDLSERRYERHSFAANIGPTPNCNTTGRNTS